MLDFTSALYLGFHHPSRSLRSWDQLSAGAPAALTVPAGTEAITCAVAALQGLGAATLATSTLHLFWDLFRVLEGEGRMVVHIDAEAYPVLRWGVERAAHRGVVVRTFRHHDADELDLAVRAGRGRRQRPVVVTDGVCPNCGRAAPLRCYLDVVRRHGGILVVDDTQALGVLGAGPGSPAPYGTGGGGSPRWHGICGPELLVAASLAKGLGAPVATLSGTPQVVARFEAESETRVHSSPPSIANLRAAEHALTLNRLGGDDLRLRLARSVLRFRARTAELGLRTLGGMFPVQTLAPVPGLEATELHRLLDARGVRAVLQRPRAGVGPRLTLLITARHRVAEIDAAIDALADAAARPAGLLRGVT